MHSPAATTATTTAVALTGKNGDDDDEQDILGGGKFLQLSSEKVMVKLLKTKNGSNFLLIM